MKRTEEGWLIYLDLSYAFNQFPTNKSLQFSHDRWKNKGTKRSKTSLYGLTDMPTEFQKAVDSNLDDLQCTLWYLADVLIENVCTTKLHNKHKEAAAQKDWQWGIISTLKQCDFSIQEK